MSNTRHIREWNLHFHSEQILCLPLELPPSVPGAKSQNGYAADKIGGRPQAFPNDDLAVLLPHSSNIIQLISALATPQVPLNGKSNALSKPVWCGTPPGVEILLSWGTPRRRSNTFLKRGKKLLLCDAATPL